MSETDPGHVAERGRPEAEIGQLRDLSTPLEFAWEQPMRNSLLLGVLLLAIFPHVLSVTAFALVWETSDFGRGVAELAALVGLPSCLIVQWSIIGTFCMLNWRPFWQRCLIFAGLALCIGTIGLLPAIPGALVQMAGPRVTDVLFQSVEDSPQYEVITEPIYLSILIYERCLWLPAEITLVLLPCFAMKVLRRWTLGPMARDIKPIPATMTSYFIATAICAVGIVFIKWGLALQFRYYGGGFAGVTQLVHFLIAGVPESLTVGVMQAWVLVDVMGSRQRSWWPWLWRLPTLLVFGGALQAMMLLVGGLVDRETIAGVSFFDGATTSFVLVVMLSLLFWCGCRWMRRLGLRLYSVA